jgi:cobalt/nickel transport system permease protein
MISEPFIAGPSAIHRLDPRVRVVMATAFAAVSAVLSGFASLAAALGVALAVALCARLPGVPLLKRLALVNLFILFLWATLPLTFGGPAVGHVGPLPLSREGVLLAARITLKSNAILLALIALVATMSFASLGHALGCLRLPSKILQLLLLTYRYVFVIEQEYNRLWRAARVRGFRPGTDLHTYRTYAYLLGMLFIRAFERAQRVHQAMRCRGFQGRFYSLQRFALGPQDWTAALLMFGTLCGMVILEWTQRN